MTDAIFLKASCSESPIQGALDLADGDHTLARIVRRLRRSVDRENRADVLLVQDDVSLAARAPVAVYDEARTHGDPAGKNLLKLPPDRLLHCRSDRAGGRGGPGVVEFVNEPLADASDKRVRVERSVQGCEPPSTNVP